MLWITPVLVLESPIFGPFPLGDALPRQHLSGGVAVVFERDEDELDLVSRDKVFDEGDDAREKGQAHGSR